MSVSLRVASYVVASEKHSKRAIASDTDRAPANNLLPILPRCVGNRMRLESRPLEVSVCSITMEDGAPS